MVARSEEAQVVACTMNRGPVPWFCSGPAQAIQPSFSLDGEFPR